MNEGLKHILIYTVAVDAGPVIWAVHCEICDDIVSDETSDGNLADQYEFEHRKVHDHWDGWEGIESSDEYVKS